MQQSSIPYSNERYNVWKRLAIFLIDALMSLGIFLGLFFSLGIFSIKSIAHDSINEMNLYMEQAIVSERLPYTTDTRFGLIKLDYDKTMDIFVNQGLDVEKANEKYYEYEAKVNEKLKEVDEYHFASSKFYAIYTVTSVCCLTLPLLVFQLLIPMFTKRHQTLAMMMFKSALADNKTGVGISNVKVLLRFIFIYVVEYLCIYLIIKWIGLFFVGLVSFATISIFNSRATLHDLTLKVQMKQIEDIYSE